MGRVLDWLADWWLCRCRHDSANVLADLLEGDGTMRVKYCRRCGAVRREYEKEWRRPQPLWHSEAATH